MIFYCFVLLAVAASQYLNCFPQNPADVTCNIYVENGTPGCDASEVVVSFNPDPNTNCTVHTAGSNTFYVSVVNVFGNTVISMTPDSCFNNALDEYGCNQFASDECVASRGGDYGSGSVIGPSFSCSSSATSGSSSTSGTSTTGSGGNSDQPPAGSSSSAADVPTIFV